jgi:hypothetical protein
MKKFSDLGVKPIMGDKKSFNCPEVSIYSVLNIPIEVVDFEKVDTSYGQGRFLVLIRVNDQEQKFFTQSAPITSALEQIDSSDFPFSATIKQRVFGRSKTFYFE